jgi:hypothetical protein
MKALPPESREPVGEALRRSESPFEEPVEEVDVTRSTGHFTRFRKGEFTASLVSLPTSAAGSATPVDADWTLRLYDDQGSRQAKGYEEQWRRFWQAINLLQFADHLEVVTTETISGGAPIYQWTPAEEEAAAPLLAADAPAEDPAEELERMELVEGEFAVARAVLDATGLLPEPQYEHEGEGRNDAQVDLAWPEARVAWGDPSAGMRAEDREVMEKDGWKVFGPEDAPEAIAEAIRTALEGR